MRAHSFRPPTAVGAAVIATFAFVHSAAAQATFYALGPQTNYVAGISADGSTAVGDTGSQPIHSYQLFRWTPGGGMTAVDGIATLGGISGDGSVLVGYSGPGSQASRWTQAGGVVGIGFLPGANRSSANAVSANGSVVAGGSGVIGTSGPPFQAFRWTQDGGMVGLGFLPGGNYSDAWGMSADGSVIVGDALDAGNAASEAFRWTESDGLVGLGIPPGMIASSAVEVSADGQVIVGSFTDGSEGGSEAFRWTEADGMVGLGGAGSYATDVSGDGNIIVGAMNAGAFVWTDQRGLQSLQTIFTHEFNLGGQLAGWQLQTAEAMSDDGRVFGGEALDPSGREEAWVVDLGRPLSLTPIPESSTYGVFAAAVLGALILTRRGARKTRQTG